MEREDVQFDETGDIIIEGSDFVLAVSDNEHIRDTLDATPGTWKENPTDGVAILDYLGSSGEEQSLQRIAKIHLKNDGYTVTVPTVIINNDTVKFYPNVRGV